MMNRVIDLSQRRVLQRNPAPLLNQASRAVRAVPDESLATMSLGNQAAQQFIQNCPLRLPGPTNCPFGGACHACPAMVHAKLEVSQPGDPAEEEADRVAEQVLHMAESATVANGAVLRGSPQPIVLRSCTDCEEEIQRQAEDEEEVPQAGIHPPVFTMEELAQDEEEERQATSQGIQRKAADLTNPVLDSVIEDLSSNAVDGNPMQSGVRAFMEPRFGRSFGGVRMHTDQGAAEMCAVMHARAFTVGKHIYFAAGQYNPADSEGKRLLAHELTHVVQQNPSQSSQDVNQPRVNWKSAIAMQRACQNFPDYASPDTYCQTQAEAAAMVTRACPPDNGDFVYHDGPSTHPWRRIPGYGCAHYVAHRLGITTGPSYANCQGGFSVTIGQVIEGKASFPLNLAQVNDIWTTGVHSGVVIETDAANNRVRVNQCNTSGNVVPVWMTSGSVYR